MINDKDLKNIMNHAEYLKEMSISDEELNKHDTFIRNISDIKDNIKNINNNIDKLKSILANSIVRLKNEEETENNIYYKIIYSKEAYNIFVLFQDMLITAQEKDPDLYKKYFNVIYPDGEEINLDTEIEIEKNNFNRIHIPIGLPKICQGIGIGKKIYLTIIKKLNYISTVRLDRSLDAIFVWDSLRKDNTIYSFVRKEQMICFNIDCDFEFIKNILLNYFKYEIEELINNINNHQFILDSDFKEKYFKEILSTDLKLLL